jgi:hypothetical protein
VDRRERIEILLSWKHPGFAVQNRTTVILRTAKELQRLDMLESRFESDARPRSTGHIESA